MVSFRFGGGVKGRSVENSELRAVSDFLDLPISKISGEFRSPAAEHAFLVDAWPVRARLIRLVCLTGFGFYGLSIGLDFLRNPEPGQLQWLVGARLGAALCLLLPIPLLRHGPTRKIEWVMFASLAVLALSFTYVTFNVLDRLIYVLMTVVVLVILNYVFLPNRFVLTVAASSLFSLLFLTMSIVYSHAPAEEKFLAILLLGALNAIGVHHIRTQNRAQRGERIKALALEKAIERRAVAEEEAATNRARTRFFMNIGHELGTPLNSIVGYIELIDEDLEAGETEDLLDDLDNLRRACFRLQRTVGNVLELSRIETGQLVVKSQKVSLTELVDEVFEELRGLAQEQGNQVFVEIGADAVIAWADPVLLRHCLTTILDNANRFTRDGEVTLTTQICDDEVVIDVVDTGVGIEPDQIMTLFQPFSRSSDSCESSVHLGSGVSLAVADIFCRRMGGQINVESELEVGTRVSVMIPAFTSG